jgi:hypothetical protein
MRVIGFEGNHGDAVLTFGCAATQDQTGVYNAILKHRLSEEQWKEYVADGVATEISPSPDVPGRACDHEYFVMRVKTDSIPGALLWVCLARSGRVLWTSLDMYTYWLFKSLEDLHNHTRHLARPLLDWSKLTRSKDAKNAAFVLDHSMVLPEIFDQEK